MRARDVEISTSGLCYAKKPGCRDVSMVMRLLDLFWVIVYFLCFHTVLLRLLVLYGLYLFFSTYGVSFSPLEIGYKATRILILVG